MVKQAKNLFHWYKKYYVFLVYFFKTSLKKCLRKGVPKVGCGSWGGSQWPPPCSTPHFWNAFPRTLFLCSWTSFINLRCLILGTIRNKIAINRKFHCLLWCGTRYSCHGCDTDADATDEIPMRHRWDANDIPVRYRCNCNRWATDETQMRYRYRCDRWDTVR